MRWSQIRHFGSVRLFRLAHVYSFSLPFMLAANEAFLGSEVGQNNGLPLFLLYSASLLLSISLLIYDTLCPVDIRRHEYRSHFNLAKLQELKAFNEYAELHAAKSEEHAQLWLDSIADKLGIEKAQKAKSESGFYAAQFMNSFGHTWEDLDKLRPIARTISVISFWLAVLLALGALLYHPVTWLALHAHLLGQAPA